MCSMGKFVFNTHAQISKARITMPEINVIKKFDLLGNNVRLTNIVDRIAP
jgi:hypothetical protein